MWCMSVVVAYHPVIYADRLGAHTGDVAYTLVYRTPSRASLSKLGVLTFACP